jgi:hypothetical protein
MAYFIKTVQPPAKFWISGYIFFSIGTTARCGLWPVEQYPSIFSYLSPTLSIFSLQALEDQAINSNFKYCTFYSLVLRTARFVLLIKFCSGDQIQKNEMGEACSTYGVEERCIQGCGVGKPEVKNHLKYPGVDGRIILRRIFGKWDVGVLTGLSWLRIGTGGGHL